MKKIKDFLDAEDWLNKIKTRGPNPNNVLLEYVTDEDKTSHYFEFDDMVDEADEAGEVLSDEGSVYCLLEERLYYVPVEIDVVPGYPTLITPQAVFELEKGDKELEVFFAYHQQTEEVGTVGELISAFPWVEQYITNNDDDYYYAFF